jgi:hypothetical protein
MRRNRCLVLVKGLVDGIAEVAAPRLELGIVRTFRAEMRLLPAYWIMARLIPEGGRMLGTVSQGTAKRPFT